ncbi:hypothetical protein EYF80_009459 [Liparis tanakae]|uniref:Uncharacterized protein n=1 Tax=Liparis tanakae TaxID=230148 RepID=A0A4Z2IR76_9TELE|nr:hypothetical protein EYF80_009459 [Liparis tanakae]
MQQQPHCEEREEGGGTLEDASVLEDGAFAITVDLVLHVDAAGHFARLRLVLRFIPSAKTTEHTVIVQTTEGETPGAKPDVITRSREQPAGV